jgi:hypothetical protein
MASLRGGYFFERFAEFNILGKDHRRWRDLPDGQITDLPVQPLLQKDSGFRLTQIKSTTPPSRPERGAYRDRHGRWARDAVDAAASGARVARGRMMLKRGR